MLGVSLLLLLAQMILTQIVDFKFHKLIEFKFVIE